MSTISFSPEDIKERIIQRLRQKNLWQEILESSVSNALIEPFSEEVAYLANYDSYLTRENKWNLARNKTSLLASQGIHRYNAHRKIGAEGTLSISSDETFNVVPVKNIEIPKYSIFSTESGVKFVAKSSYVLTTSDKYIDIDIIQGIPRTYPYVATGIDFEEFEIDSTLIENSFFEMYVNSVLWKSTDNIFNAGATDKYYELSNKIDFSGIYIKCGNNINGVKLNSGDIVEFKYVETSGYTGNISTSNTVNTIDSTILDIDGSVVDVFCKNDDAIVGGLDVEDRESIRVNAPQFMNAGGTASRATSISDYKSIITNNFSYILKIQCWGVNENLLDQGLNPYNANISYANTNVELCAIRTDLSPTLSDAQKLEIANTVNEVKAPTDILNFNDALIIPVIFTVTAKASRNYTLSSVKLAIDTALENAYGIEQMEFFQFIYLSDYYNIIDNVTGVTNAIVSVKFYQTFDLNLTWSFTDELVMYPITNNTVEIYMIDNVNNTTVLVATDVDGVLTAEVGYDISGSTIDMTSGEIAFIIDSSPFTEAYSDYTVKIYYSTTEDDLELKERNQIFDYNSSESLDLITVTYQS